MNLQRGDGDMDPTGETRNQDLQVALTAYAIDALEVIRTHDWGATRGLPAHLWQKVKITGQGMTSYLAAEVDWSVVLSSCEADLRQLSAYEVAENAMRSDARVARHLDTTVGNSQRMTRVDINTCFRSFLFRLVADQQDAFFVEDKFERIFREMEDYFYGDTLRRRVVAPLTDFTMEGEAIALGEGLTINRLASAEREEFASRSIMFPSPPFGGHGSTGWEEFAFDFYAEVPKVIGERIVPGSGQGLGLSKLRPRNVTKPLLDSVVQGRCGQLQLYQSKNSCVGTCSLWRVDPQTGRGVRWTKVRTSRG